MRTLLRPGRLDDRNINTNRWEIGVRTRDGCSWLGSCSVAGFGVVGVAAACDIAIEFGIFCACHCAPVYRREVKVYACIKNSSFLPLSERWVA
jgi:hypothetical protein